MLIAHATDLTGDDDAAFVHATALAAASAARLVTIHGNAETATPQLPDGAALAARWGRTITHERRCHECCDDVADTVIDAMRVLHPDLVVLGTHGRHGFAALLGAGSVGETIARNLDAPALVVPNRSRGFVDAKNGAIDLHRIVIPAGNIADATRGVSAARDILAMAGVDDAELEIVHVGDEDPALAKLGVKLTRVQGKLEDAILEVARTRQACMIVMPTSGHDGFGDVLLGSHTERVIREAECPVLSVPG